MTDPIIEMARDRIERGSKSFAGAARLFTPDVRDSAIMLYAWCRHCDDEIDGQVLGFQRSEETARPLAETLAALRDKTIAATEGRADEPIYQALQRVTAKHAIPQRHPLELIHGMQMDVEMETAGRRYRTLDDLLEYCYHVAGVVGVMMAMIMGVRDRATLQRASDLGIAFQLTNIARDVIPDATVGRLYLPVDWLDRAGLSETTLARPDNRAVVAAVTADLLHEAERYYTSARAGVPHLPFRSAWAIAAARRVYRDIGTLVHVRGAQAWDERVSTSKARKLTGIALAGADAAWARSLGQRTHYPPRQALWTPPSLASA